MADKRVIHFVLSPEDSDLIAWKMALPKRRFNRTVCEILVYESMGKIATVPHQFSSRDLAAPVHCLLRVQDENVIRLIDSIKPGEIATYIKKIIRKHIKKSQDELITVSDKLLIQLAKNLKADLEYKRHRLLETASDLGYENYGKELPKIFSSIIEAYKFGDEKYGDGILSELADEDAIRCRFCAFECDDC